MIGQAGSQLLLCRGVDLLHRGQPLLCTLACLLRERESLRGALVRLLSEGQLACEALLLLEHLPRRFVLTLLDKDE